MKTVVGIITSYPTWVDTQLEHRKRGRMVSPTPFFYPGLKGNSDNYVTGTPGLVRYISLWKV
jgi:hypothetical protein